MLGSSPLPLHVRLSRKKAGFYSQAAIYSEHKVNQQINLYLVSIYPSILACQLNIHKINVIWKGLYWVGFIYNNIYNIFYIAFGYERKHTMLGLNPS